MHNLIVALHTAVPPDSNMRQRRVSLYHYHAQLALARPRTTRGLRAQREARANCCSELPTDGASNTAREGDAPSQRLMSTSGCFPAIARLLAMYFGPLYHLSTQPALRYRDQLAVQELSPPLNCPAQPTPARQG